MEIVDLNDDHRHAFFHCLEEWSEEMKEAGDHKEKWYDEMRDRGVRVKIAVVDHQACGMVQYLPVEHAFVEGKGCHFIPCIWVHGYKWGVGNHQKRGIGRALLEAAEEDARSLGATGMAAWGLSLPFWMKASWYKKQGYTRVDKDGMRVLMWKPFGSGGVPPKWIRRRKKPEKEKGVVIVTAFTNGWCPAQNIVFERAKRAAAEFGDRVEFREVRTIDRATYLEWGISDALYIDGREVRIGPPPSYDKIKRKIARRAGRIKPAKKA
jgi:GNAT superfamily N-acetyltransferase